MGSPPWAHRPNRPPKWVDYIDVPRSEIANEAAWWSSHCFDDAWIVTAMGPLSGDPQQGDRRHDRMEQIIIDKLVNPWCPQLSLII